MHLDMLSGDPDANVRPEVQRAVDPREYFEARPPAGNGIRIIIPPRQAERGVYGFHNPDARQRELKIKAFDGKELCQGLSSGFLDWGRRFERQIVLAQAVCGFAWSEDVKVDLLSHYLEGMAEKYYNKQIMMWWEQCPTLQYAMERMLQAFKTQITPAQSMELFTRPKDPKRSWIEHLMFLNAVSEASGHDADYLVLNNIVQHASQEMKTVLMAKVDDARTNYLVQADELAHFAQVRESSFTSRRTGRGIVNAVQDRRNLHDRRHTDTRKCYLCGKIGHIRRNCPQEDGREQVKENLTLMLSGDGNMKSKSWILDSGSSRHLVGDLSWLIDVEAADGTCTARR